MTRHKPLKLSNRAKKTLGIPFSNAKFPESALAHPSYRNENPGLTLYDFDRLEFFGDAILNYVICHMLYYKFPSANEGLLSRLRSVLVSRKILARIAKEIRLHRLLRLGKSLDTQPLSSKSKVFADSLEALIAAIYLDKGLPLTEKFILKHFHAYFDMRRLFRLDPNPKSTLQELSQKFWQKLPSYTCRFTATGAKVTAAVGKKRNASASATTKQQGEEKAARLLIQKIRQELALRSKRASSGKKFRRTF